MADGGAISVPAMMAIGGAVAGGAMDKEQPLRGAALGAFGGYTGGAALGAAGAAGSGTAAGMGGAVGSGITAPTAVGAAGSAGMGGALGSGVGATAGGMTPLALAGGASPMGGAGMGLLAAEGAGVSGALPALGQGASGGLLAGGMGQKMGEQALSMGGQMLMKDQQAKQGQPVMPGVAPPMMKPNFAMPSFMSSAPSFNPVIAGLPQNRGVAADPRRRG